MRELFESTIERLLTDLVTPELIRRCEAGHWPIELWEAIEASGFAVAAAPELQGGSAASWGDLYGVVKAAGRHNLPLPLPETMFANWLLGQCGIDAHNAPLSIAMRNTLKLNHEFTSGAFFDVPWVAPADTRVHGVLFDVPWGRDVKHVVAIMPGERTTLVVLARSDAEISTKRNTAGEPRDDLNFKNAIPLTTATLPEHLSDDVICWGGSMLRTAQMAGALEATLNLSTRYATERVQFGKPISAFQAIQHQLAQMAQQTGSAIVSAEAAFAESGDQLAAWQIASAKICGAEAAGAVAAMAHAVHGAIGFTHEHALQLGTRRLWAWRSEFGNLGYWAQRLGRAVSQGGSASLWPAVTNGQLPALESLRLTQNE
jgi:acyl-CoA dehydrogenase